MTVQLLARVVCCSVLLLANSYSSVLADAQESTSSMSISEGKTISIEYTLTLEDKSAIESIACIYKGKCKTTDSTSDNKEVLDTNVGGEPLTFTQGSHQIIPGLETALEGMKVGERKQITVATEQGYGSINPQAIHEVELEKIPEEARKVGAKLLAKDGQGRTLHPRVTEVKEQVAVLDFNHPLAGHTLLYDIKILDIQTATTPEP